ncbi:UL1 [Papiine alphaherpesvirus 2]|uniref:Envelope glycoprotein L n=1 Tax=Cercopithecine herpesvirus 16 TaxID=340907 RepID=Q2QBH6_CHV16|nr:envelope glycoprotein L [Papiine alphaherpesvirus 2]UYB79370.1 envelope glycoprotein L [synthetic construct]ABA29254.1 UL1 [Papiine alphaherpesvirus 2]AHM95977.1 envelope glycoprotein L [Papiine alphaherpesvirus 2]UYB79443.1 envelope glycoprotein L [synthetic construct]UYB79517.1 envelope glycoprotein L [Papiine alphaherpesvirus 2]
MAAPGDVFSAPLTFFVCSLYNLLLSTSAASPPTEYLIQSVAARTVADVLKVACLQLPDDGVTWRYEAPRSIDYARIDGIFLRYHCPGLDTVLWDGTAQRAYWVNPFLFTAGFLEDLSHALFPDNALETATRRALYKEVRLAVASRSGASSGTPVPPGCVNSEYSRTRQCLGRDTPGLPDEPRPRRPLSASGDEAAPQPFSPATPTSPAAPARRTPKPRRKPGGNSTEPSRPRS